jgi:hypothetical protein
MTLEKAARVCMGKSLQKCSAVEVEELRRVIGQGECGDGQFCGGGEAGSQDNDGVGEGR